MEWSASLGGGGVDVKKRDTASLAMDTLSGWANLVFTHWLGVGPTYQIRSLEDIQAFGCTMQKMLQRTTGYSRLTYRGWIS